MTKRHMLLTFINASSIGLGFVGGNLKIVSEVKFYSRADVRLYYWFTGGAAYLVIIVIAAITTATRTTTTAVTDDD